ncbi:MAG: rod shape-determining protein MreC [Candidatus Petromonas sp.]|nr:rod shape-determining protein MreC [Candidatus Petromonas sp.]
MIVTVVTIIIIIIMGVTFGGREHITFAENKVGNIVTPAQKFLFLGSNFIYKLVEPITNIWKLDKENELLKEENRKLQNKIIQLTLSRQERNDLQNLRSALNYTKSNGIKNYITSNVIAKDPGNWYHMFTIDAGLKDGITKNSTVMNGDGLIGLVYEVGDTWSKVISIIDNKSRVSFEILDVENDNIGMINGKGTAYLSGYLIDPQAKVNVGDKIITSGLGLYPKGILIGSIKDVIIKKDELLKSIVVEPSVDFKNIDKVLIIPKKYTEEK